MLTYALAYLIEGTVLVLEGCPEERVMFLEYSAGDGRVDMLAVMTANREILEVPSEQVKEIVR